MERVVTVFGRLVIVAGMLGLAWLGLELWSTKVLSAAVLLDRVR